MRQSANSLDRITQTQQGAQLRTFGYGITGFPYELATVTDSQTGTAGYSYDAQGNQ